MTIGILALTCEMVGLLLFEQSSHEKGKKADRYIRFSALILTIGFIFLIILVNQFWS